ncbi:MAG: trypsin-like peptidase domain-containing protein [Anaerolineae bacterium]
MLTVFLVGAFLGSAAMFSFMLTTLNRAVGQGPSAPPTPTLPPPNVFEAAEALQQVMINLYQRVNPSVVHIASVSQEIDLFYGVTNREGTGSGFVYSSDGQAGIVVTNYHVINNAQEVNVIFADGATYPAQVIGVDVYYDLAVLRVDAPNMTPLELGDSSTLRVGQTVIAVGNPFGLDRTMTSGLVSALGRRIDTREGAVIGQAIQTDAAINPGNSGGPLLDLRGRVIGINTAINSPSGGSVGIGFAVPSNVVKRVVPVLIRDGRYPHPSLDIQVAELGTELTPGRDLPQRGLLIVQVAAGGAADRAGLQPTQITRRGFRYYYNGGDIIVAVGGKPVTSRNDLFLALDENYAPGETVILTIVRDGQSAEVPVVLGSQ